MKEWKLSEDSWGVKWAYLAKWLVFDDMIPHQTSLCKIFWRSALLTPLQILIPIVVISLLGIAGYQIYKDGATTILFALGTLTVVSTYLFLLSWLSGNNSSTTINKIEDFIEKSTIINGAIAIKRKMCPIVRIESRYDIAFIKAKEERAAGSYSE